MKLNTQNVLRYLYSTSTNIRSLDGNSRIALYITSKNWKITTLADPLSLVKDFVRATDIFYMYIHIYIHIPLPYN